MSGVQMSTEPNHSAEMPPAFPIKIVYFNLWKSLNGYTNWKNEKISILIETFIKFILYEFNSDKYAIGFIVIDRGDIREVSLW